MRLGRAVSDNAGITVIVERFGLITYDCHNRNAKQPKYRHRAGLVGADR